MQLVGAGEHAFDHILTDRALAAWSAACWWPLPDTVGRALDGPAIGDPSGGVLAMMNTLLPSGAPVYRPDAVTQIMFVPGAYPTPADAPDC